MPFLPSNQQRQSTEGKQANVLIFPNFFETAKDAICFSNPRLALFIL